MPATGPRADANPGLHRGPAGQVRGGPLLAGGRESEGLSAHGREVYGTGEGGTDHGSAEVGRRDMLGRVVGVSLAHLAAP